MFVIPHSQRMCRFRMEMNAEIVYIPSDISIDRLVRRDINNDRYWGTQVNVLVLITEIESETMKKCLRTLD